MAKILTDRNFIKVHDKNDIVTEAINLIDSPIDFSKDPTVQMEGDSLIKTVVRHLLASYYTDYPDHDTIVSRMTTINNVELIEGWDKTDLRKLLVEYAVHQVLPETLLIIHFPETPEFMIDEKDAITINTEEYGLYNFTKDVWDVSEFLGLEIKEEDDGYYAFYTNNSAGNTMLHALLENRRNYFHTFENNGTYISWMSNAYNTKSNSIYDVISYDVKQDIMKNTSSTMNGIYYVITKIHNDSTKDDCEFESDHDIITMFDNDLYFGTNELICTRTTDDETALKFENIGFKEIRDISNAASDNAHFFVLDNGSEAADFLIKQYRLGLKVAKTEEIRTDVVTENYDNNSSISYYRAYAKNGDNNDFLARDILSFGDILDNKFDSVIIISYVNLGDGTPKDLFDAFAKAHENEIILLRIGYDCDEKESYINGEFCELIADAEEAGFRDINTLCGFEYSIPFIYKNERSKELRRAIVRWEIRQHSEGFIFEDVAKDLSEKKNS